MVSMVSRTGVSTPPPTPCNSPPPLITIETIETNNINKIEIGFDGKGGGFDGSPQKEAGAGGIEPPTDRGSREPDPRTSAPAHPGLAPIDQHEIAHLIGMAPDWARDWAEHDPGLSLFLYRCFAAMTWQRDQIASLRATLADDQPGAGWEARG